MNLLFATNNKHKVAEMQQMLPAAIQLQTMHDVGFIAEIAEPFDSFEENAHNKAATLHRHFGRAVFAEDSGLIVPALGGAPGVHSARYAGPQRSDKDNNEKLLHQVAGKNRSAYFTTVICFIDADGKVHYFKGVCEGVIATAFLGNAGFGYDPIFIPQGHQQSFAQLGAQIKNSLSHRRRATDKLVAFLKQHYLNTDI